jgi:hypothetical protein
MIGLQQNIVLIWGAGRISPKVEQTVFSNMNAS